jgi:adenylate cyclase
VRPVDADERKRLKDEEGIRRVLLGTSRGLRFGRLMFRRLPSSTRCKLCASPFHGAFGGVMHVIGKGPWPKNPKYCSTCFKQMVQHRAGAEIACSLLFADVRGSTELAEGMRPTEFRGLMDRFFSISAKVLVDHDAIVDKFVGDEVIAIFIPGLAGERHASRAIAAGRALLTATGHGAGEPWVPIGAGVNTGVAYVGAVGPDDQAEFTAMGDPVNVTARLASAAGPGELLVTAAAAQAAQLDDSGLEHRALTLKGKSAPTQVVVMGAPS